MGKIQTNPPALLGRTDFCLGPGERTVLGGPVALTDTQPGTLKPKEDSVSLKVLFLKKTLKNKPMSAYVPNPPFSRFMGGVGGTLRAPQHSPPGP